MNNLSPLVRSALDSFFHALDHDKIDTEKDRRFTISHLDNAIELLLKEKVKLLGQSLWKKDKTTIGIYDCKNIFETQDTPIIIPEWPDIEDLHQIRNDIEHFGSTPTKSQNEFYVLKAKNFIQRFLKEELNIDAAEIEKEYKIEEKLPVIESEAILKDSENLYLMNKYDDALINGFIGLELKLREISKPFIKDSEKYPFVQLLNQISKIGVLSREQIEMFENIWNFRNKIVHRVEKPDKESIMNSLKEINNLIEILNKSFYNKDENFINLFKEINPKTEMEKVLLCIYGFLKLYNTEKINVNDIRNLLVKLRLSIPSNINDILIKLKSKGLVEVSIGKKDFMTAWYITLHGEKYIENLRKK